MCIRYATILGLFVTLMSACALGGTPGYTDPIPAPVDPCMPSYDACGPVSHGIVHCADGSIWVRSDPTPSRTGAWSRYDGQADPVCVLWDPAPVPAPVLTPAPTPIPAPTPEQDAGADAAPAPEAAVIVPNDTMPEAGAAPAPEAAPVDHTVCACQVLNSTGTAFDNWACGVKPQAVRMRDNLTMCTPTQEDCYGPCTVFNVQGTEAHGTLAPVKCSELHNAFVCDTFTW